VFVSGVILGHVINVRPMDWDKYGKMINLDVMIAVIEN
jgi:hypothetical protein